MTDSIATLLGLLQLEKSGTDRFTGTSPATDQPRIFGGQVVAQGLAAAGRTVGAERIPHSLQAQFLHAGDPSVPVDYLVESVRDSRSFSTRRVVACQRQRSILVMTASFHGSDHGPEHADPMPAAVPAEQLPTLDEQLARRPEDWSDFYREWSCFELRVTAPPREPLPAPAGHANHSQVWFRAGGPVGDDPLVLACALAYASDVTLLASTLAQHRLPTTVAGITTASLDHCMWFHRPFRLDDWLLYDQLSPSAHAGRGLALGRIFEAGGRLVATVAQETLIRTPRA